MVGCGEEAQKEAVQEESVQEEAKDDPSVPLAIPCVACGEKVSRRQRNAANAVIRLPTPLLLTRRHRSLRALGPRRSEGLRRLGPRRSEGLRRKTLKRKLFLSLRNLVWKIIRSS